MKKKMFLMGMVTLMCAIGLMVAGCDSGGRGDGKIGSRDKRYIERGR